MNAIEKVNEIKQWLNSNPGSCLANGERGSYARGYREGFLQAVGIVREMMVNLTEIGYEELYRIDRRQEEAEFKAKVKELYEAGKFVHKPYYENGVHEEQYDLWEYELELEEDERPVLLANFDEGPDDVRIDKIVVHGAKFEDGWIALEGESSRNYGCEYAFGIDDLEHAHLSFLTAEI